MDVHAVWGKFMRMMGFTEAMHSSSFNLLRWFSLVSLAIIATVALGLGYVSTRFVVNESLERDAMLSAQFIHTLAVGEIVHHDVPWLHIVDLFIPRQFSVLSQDSLARANRARFELLDHLKNIPDNLLISVYSPDRVIVWSSNPTLIGKRVVGDDELEEAFDSKDRVTARYSEVSEARSEQQFLHPPKSFFVENYLPLLDEDNHVVAIIELYKEPVDLIDRIKRGYRLMWFATALGGLLIYFGLYWIVRRASRMLEMQQAQLVANKTYVVLGEMSTAVAHSMRNPLASIRSSAELAEAIGDQSIQKNVRDIISQVDRMSVWISELLRFVRPPDGVAEKLNLGNIVRDTVSTFEHQLKEAGISVDIEAESSPLVISHRQMLPQILNSLLSNAVEAMPEGGQLTIRTEAEKSGQWLHLTVSDTGHGMTPQQVMMAFKPFQTTKRGGLGVGLAMVKQIMERFGGNASLTSRDGVGTVVRLSFRTAADGVVEG